MLFRSGKFDLDTEWNRAAPAGVPADHGAEIRRGGPWDCAAVSLRAIDQNGNLLPYCGEAVCLSVEGPLKILGPSVVPLRGGMAGTYLATTGEAGRAVLHCRMEGALDTEAVLTVRSREEQNV